MITRFAVQLKNDKYLTSMDEDEREIIPLFATKAAAKEAAERSDMEHYKVVTIKL